MKIYFTNLWICLFEIMGFPQSNFENIFENILKTLLKIFMDFLKLKFILITHI